MKDRLLKNIAKLQVHRPYLVVFSFIILSIVGLYMGSKLKVTMRWSDLLPTNRPSVKEFNKIIEKYKSASTVIVAVEGVDRENIENFVEDYVKKIKRHKLIKRIDYIIDTTFYLNHGLMIMKTKDLKNSTDLFKTTDFVDFVKNLNHTMEKTYIYSEDEEVLSNKEKTDKAIMLVDAIRDFVGDLNSLKNMKQLDTNRVFENIDKFFIGEKYFYSYDKKMVLINIIPTFTIVDLEKCIELTHFLRNTGKIVNKKYPSVKFGLTGFIAMGSDEMDSIEPYMLPITLITFILIILIFIIFFKMWISPILAGVVLIVSVILSSALAYVFYGHLNIMTSMFAVILLGLGIDFSIHIISNMLESLSNGYSVEDSIYSALNKVGGGIITGAMTTGFAFLVLLVSENRGMKEFGAVVGIGVIVAMAVTIMLLPALLSIYFKKKKDVKKKISDFKLLGRIGQSFADNRIVMIVIIVILSVIFMRYTLNLRFDYKMLNMEPKDMESVIYNDKIIEKYEISPDYALFSSSSLDTLKEVASFLKRYKIIANVTSITDIIKDSITYKNNKEIILNIKKYFENRQIPKLNSKRFKLLLKYLDTLWMNVYEMGNLAFTNGQSKLEKRCFDIVKKQQDKDSDLIKMTKASLQYTWQNNKNILAKYSEIFLKHYNKRVSNLLNTEIVTIENLPVSIKQQYISDDGKEFLMTIYAKDDVWDLKRLKVFTKILKNANPRITGTPPLYVDLIDMISADGKKAIILSIIIIFIFLMLDFKNIYIALITLIPLGVSLVTLGFVMNIMGIMINVNNIIAFPLLLGIGIDDGVHFVHRYLKEGNNIYKAYSSTGKAALLTTITTVIGFGALIIFPHRGMASMGLVLAIGISICWISTVLIVAPFISLIKK